MRHPLLVIGALLLPLLLQAPEGWAGPGDADSLAGKFAAEDASPALSNRKATDKIPAKPSNKAPNKTSRKAPDKATEDEKRRAAAKAHAAAQKAADAKRKAEEARREAEQLKTDEAEMLARARAEAEERRQAQVKAREESESAEREREEAERRAAQAAADAEREREAARTAEAVTRAREEAALRKAEAERLAREREEHRLAEQREAEEARIASEAKRRDEDERRAGRERRILAAEQRAAEAERLAREAEDEFDETAPVYANEDRRRQRDRRPEGEDEPAEVAEGDSDDEDNFEDEDATDTSVRRGGVPPERFQGSADAWRVYEDAAARRERDRNRAGRRRQGTLPGDDGREDNDASRFLSPPPGKDETDDDDGDAPPPARHHDDDTYQGDEDASAPAPLDADFRVSVLLAMEPGSRGIRRFGPKTADPMLCVADRCYISNGPDAAARELPRRQAFGPGVALGTRAGACRHSLVCVFRRVDLGGESVTMQPIDLRILRHDRRTTATVSADESCRVRGGMLVCAAPVVASSYRAWIVPEKTAEEAGPRALTDALEAGLPARYSDHRYSYR